MTLPLSEVYYCPSEDPAPLSQRAPNPSSVAFVQTRRSGREERRRRASLEHRRACDNVKIQKTPSLLLTDRYNREYSLDDPAARHTLAAEATLPPQYRTAGRRARSETLLIGSTPSTWVKV